MIKFFKNIRKKLISENRSIIRNTNYFKYAIGEILLVVIGILLALQLEERTIEVAFFNNQSKNHLLEKALELGGELNFNERLKNQSLLKKFLTPEKYSELFFIMEGVQGWRNASELRTLNSLKQIQEENNSVIEYIKNEMKE